MFGEKSILVLCFFLGGGYLFLMFSFYGCLVAGYFKVIAVIGVFKCCKSVFLRFTFHNEEKLTVSFTLNFAG